MIYGLGMLESGITFDYGQLVLDCEFARMIKHTVQGIDVNDETLALDTVKETGPGGDYLMNPHTFKWMRSQSRAEVIDRKMRGAWEKAGATTAPFFYGAQPNMGLYFQPENINIVFLFFSKA